MQCLPPYILDQKKNPLALMNNFQLVPTIAGVITERLVESNSGIATSHTVYFFIHSSYLNPFQCCSVYRDSKLSPPA